MERRESSDSIAIHGLRTHEHDDTVPETSLPDRKGAEIS